MNYSPQAYTNLAIDSIPITHQTLMMNVNDSEKKGDLALGSAIRKSRIKASMSQIQLAEAAGLEGQGQISRIESGVQGVTTYRLRSIAKALNMRVTELWAIAEGIQPPPPPEKKDKEKNTSPSNDIHELRAVTLAFMSSVIDSLPNVKNDALRRLSRLSLDLQYHDFVDAAFRYLSSDVAVTEGLRHKMVPQEALKSSDPFSY